MSMKPIDVCHAPRRGCSGVLIEVWQRKCVGWPCELFARWLSCGSQPLGEAIVGGGFSQDMGGLPYVSEALELRVARQPSA